MKRKTLYRLLILSGLGIVMIALAGLYVMYDHGRRGYESGCFFAAIKYGLESGSPNETMRDVMSSYNEYDRHLFEFCLECERPHEYLSPRGLPNGEYLVFIEADPGILSDWMRHVIYATPDGDRMRMESAWCWQLDDIRAADAQARRANSQADH